MRAVLAAIDDGLVLWAEWVEAHVRVKRDYGLAYEPAEWLSCNYIPGLLSRDQRYTTIARGTRSRSPGSPVQRPSG